jgi:hypothetical protein
VGAPPDAADGAFSGYGRRLLRLRSFSWSCGGFLILWAISEYLNTHRKARAWVAYPHALAMLRNRPADPDLRTHATGATGRLQIAPPHRRRAVRRPRRRILEGICLCRERADMTGPFPARAAAAVRSESTVGGDRASGAHHRRVITASEYELAAAAIAADRRLSSGGVATDRSLHARFRLEPGPTPEQRHSPRCRSRTLRV